MVKQALTTQLQWEGDRGSNMQQCVEMVNEWSLRILPTVDHNADFEIINSAAILRSAWRCLRAQLKIQQLYWYLG